jgi:hypothetical protein
MHTTTATENSALEEMWAMCEQADAFREAGRYPEAEQLY